NLPRGAPAPASARWLGARLPLNRIAKRPCRARNRSWYEEIHPSLIHLGDDCHSGSPSERDRRARGFEANPRAYGHLRRGLLAALAVRLASTFVMAQVTTGADAKAAFWAAMTLIVLASLIGVPIIGW